MSLGQPLATYFPTLERVTEPYASWIEPPLDHSADLLTQLRWKGRSVEVTVGVDLDIRIEEDPHGRGTTFAFGTSRSISYRWTFDRIWDQLNGIEEGVRLYRAALAKAIQL